MTLVSVTAYHSFGGEVEASNTPTIRRLTPSCRHQLPRIAPQSMCACWPHRMVSLGRLSLRIFEILWQFNSRAPIISADAPAGVSCLKLHSRFRLKSTRKFHDTSL